MASIAICVLEIISAVILPASLTVQLRCVKSKSLAQSLHVDGKKKKKKKALSPMNTGNKAKEM